MKNIQFLNIIFLLFIAQIGYSQNTPETPIVFSIVEQMPEFPGGEKALLKMINDSTVYPAEAVQQELQGKVIVGFVVKDDGSIDDVRIRRSSSFPSLDNEAIRVIKTMPNWIPGKQQGKKVNVSYVLPIVFKLENSDTKVYEKVDTMPTFHGGNTAYLAFLSKNLSYPQFDVEAENQGISEISFVVNEDGTLSKISVNRTSGFISLDKEATRFVASMPKWVPGEKDGKAVKVLVKLPIIFKLH